MMPRAEPSGRSSDPGGSANAPHARGRRPETGHAGPRHPAAGRSALRAAVLARDANRAGKALGAASRRKPRAPTTGRSRRPSGAAGAIACGAKLRHSRPGAANGRDFTRRRAAAPGPIETDLWPPSRRIRRRRGRLCGKGATPYAIALRAPLSRFRAPSRAPSPRFPSRARRRFRTVQSRHSHRLRARRHAVAPCAAGAAPPRVRRAFGVIVCGSIAAEASGGSRPAPPRLRQAGARPARIRSAPLSTRARACAAPCAFFARDPVGQRPQRRRRRRRARASPRARARHALRARGAPKGAAGRTRRRRRDATRRSRPPRRRRRATPARGGSQDSPLPALSARARRASLRRRLPPGRSEPA